MDQARYSINGTASNRALSYLISKVIEAISKEGGACVAVKCVDLSNIEDSEIEMGYLQEVKMLKMFNCPRIIKLIDW